MTSKFLFSILSVGLLLSCGNAATTNQPAESQPAAAEAAPATPAAPAATPFDKTVTYESISFRVTSPGTATGNAFTLTPSGLAASNDPYSQEIGSHQVVDVITDDMDGDNSPEVVVTARSADGKVQAFVFSTFNRKSMGSVNYPEVADAKLLEGYQGGDEYNMVENRFIRRFPLYANGQATGKYRQLQYKLKAGEAMKQLVLDRTTEY